MPKLLLMILLIAILGTLEKLKPSNIKVLDGCNGGAGVNHHSLL